MKENPDWKFYTVVPESQELKINGINVWEHKWNSDYESIIVKDPKYGDLKKLTKYWITTNDETIEFVAGEFSNTIYGFYLKAELLEKQPNVKSKSILERIVSSLKETFGNSNKG
ncbi:hypothetical protein ACFQ1M_05005 [Sungkyunkwania multivorans]|uniref:Uncharacterized protein n=1 Tax=Sungkyunkwania multivorans TaxID=1173618 RepID=A0ABW3CWM3_9FLAO